MICKYGHDTVGNLDGRCSKCHSEKQKERRRIKKEMERCNEIAITTHTSKRYELEYNS
jgi:hypothetical protein